MTYELTRENMVEVPFKQPIISSDGVIGGDTFACASSGTISSSYTAHGAFDGSASTPGWAADTNNSGWLEFYNPVPIKVTQLSIMNNYEGIGYNVITAGNVQAYDGNDWVTLASFTNSSVNNSAIWHIDLSSNTAYYNIYRVGCTATSNRDYPPCITELYITATQLDEPVLDIGYNVFGRASGNTNVYKLLRKTVGNTDTYKMIQVATPETLLPVPQMTGTNQDGFTVECNHYSSQYSPKWYTLFSPLSSGYYAGSASKPDMVGIKFPNSCYVARIAIRQNIQFNSIAHSGYISITTDGINYSQLKTFTMNTTLNSITEIPVGVDCVGYRLYFTDNASPTTPNNGIAIRGVSTYINSTGVEFYKSNVTVVGSLTDNIGVLSGFSANDYATIGTFSPSSNTIEAVLEFTTSSSLSSSMGLLGGLGSQDGFTPFYIDSSGYLVGYISSNGLSWNILDKTNPIMPLSPNTTYRVKCEFTGSAYKWYLLENESWTLVKTVNSSDPVYGGLTLQLGTNRGQNSPFNGTINLNESYIKVGDSIWWQGRVPL